MPGHGGAGEIDRAGNAADADAGTDADAGDEYEDQPDPDAVDRRRVGLAAAALIAALTLVVGLGAGFLIGRPSHPGDDSVDAGFARDMSVHHGQAVAMSMPLYRESTDPNLRQVA